MGKSVTQRSTPKKSISRQNIKPATPAVPLKKILPAKQPSKKKKTSRRKSLSKENIAQSLVLNPVGEATPVKAPLIIRKPLTVIKELPEWSFIEEEEEEEIDQLVCVRGIIDLEDTQQLESTKRAERRRSRRLSIRREINLESTREQSEKKKKQSGESNKRTERRRSGRLLAMQWRDAFKDVSKSDTTEQDLPQEPDRPWNNPVDNESAKNKQSSKSSVTFSEFDTVLETAVDLDQNTTNSRTKEPAVSKKETYLP